MKQNKIRFQPGQKYYCKDKKTVIQVISGNKRVAAVHFIDSSTGEVSGLGLLSYYILRDIYYNKKRKKK